MPYRLRSLPCIVGLLVLFAGSGHAAQAQSGSWTFDPSALVQGGDDIVRRAPDGQIDALFQALHASAGIPVEAGAICGLFAPDADRSLGGIGSAMSRLGPASRDRFAGALADMLLSAGSGPAQPFDPAMANKALKTAAVTAAIRNDGFVAALNGQGQDAASQQGRCKALGWLLDAAALQPLGERAAMTRLLMRQGLQQLPEQR